ncbi:MAG: hypothetical protein AB7K68_04495 [Bacteriovoracia bacterium]
MKIWPAFLIFISSVAFAGGSGFVGNGGDGVEIEGRLYVRDLVMLGIHESPFVGESTDPRLPVFPTSRAMPFSFPRELLARKLTDLNRVAPGMGDFLLVSMKLYTWVLQDFPLTPINNPGDTVILPPGSKVVQIANRLGTTIRIHRESWNRLNDENKAALLIHEAVYSLVRPVREEGSKFFQPARTAQEITGAFFSSSFLSKDPARAYEALSNVLAIPFPMRTTVEWRQLPVWTIDYERYNLVHPILGKAHKFDFSKKPTHESLQKFAFDECHSIEKIKGREDAGDFYRARSVFISWPLDFGIKQYRTTSPEVPLQSYVALSYNSRIPDIVDYEFGTAEACINSFSWHLRLASAGL